MNHTLSTPFSKGVAFMMAGLVAALAVVMIFISGALGVDDSKFMILAFLLPCTVAGFVLGRASSAPRVREAVVGVLLLSAVAALFAILDEQHRWTPGIEVPDGFFRTLLLGVVLGSVLAALGVWLGRKTR